MSLKSQKNGYTSEEIQKAILQFQEKGGVIKKFEPQKAVRNTPQLSMLDQMTGENVHCSGMAF